MSIEHATIIHGLASKISEVRKHKQNYCRDYSQNRLQNCLSKLSTLASKHSGAFSLELRANPAFKHL